MLRWLLLLLLVIPSSGSAAEYKLLNVRELSAETYEYRGVYRDSYTLQDNGEPRQLTRGGALNLNVDFANAIYMDNHWHLAGDEAQVRQVGWQYETGFYFRAVELYWHHHSQHVLDQPNPRNDKFPLENWYGIRVTIIGNRHE